MPKKVNPTRCGGTWTESKYFTFIRSLLRRGWSVYPVRFQALLKSRRPYKGDDKRTKWEYQCNECKQWFKTKEVEVDHLYMTGGLKTYNDLPEFCRRLFCEVDDLQVVCKPCHKEITAKQRERGWK